MRKGQDIIVIIILVVYYFYPFLKPPLNAARTNITDLSSQSQWTEMTHAKRSFQKNYAWRASFLSTVIGCSRNLGCPHVEFQFRFWLPGDATHQVRKGQDIIVIIILVVYYFYPCLKPPPNVCNCEEAPSSQNNRLDSKNNYMGLWSIDPRHLAKWPTPRTKNQVFGSWRRSLC